MWWRLYIFMRIFFALRKSSFPSWLTMLVFSEVFLPQYLVMSSTDLHWPIICSFTKKACTQKICLEIPKGIERLQQKRLCQFPFYRFRPRASPVSLLLKLKTIAACFEHDIFCSNLKDNVYGQVYSYKYCRLLLPK